MVCMGPPISIASNPTFVEATAIVEGLELAQETGITDFLLETDCKLLVDRILKQEEDFSDIGHIVLVAEKGHETTLLSWDCPY